MNMNTQDENTSDTSANAQVIDSNTQGQTESKKEAVSLPKQMESVYAALGYTFNDDELLQQALSHRSMGKKSNERLEFLGDAVLNFVIASELFRLYPELREGDLSRLRSNLVNGELVAELARDIRLWEHLYLGVGETKSGGGQRTSILADAMEAIIGAIYLDAGLDVCREQILRWYGRRLEEAAIISYKDPKTRLQELTQSKKLPLPTYRVVKVEGLTHAQTFLIECRVKNIEQTSVGAGTTKRKAEQNAAELFLAKLEEKFKEQKERQEQERKLQEGVSQEQQESVKNDD